MVRNAVDSYSYMFVLHYSCFIQVVDKPLPWSGGLVAVNSFGFGGANAHILLRTNPKPKAPAIQDNIPRLVALSGRTEEAVNYFLDKVRITVCISCFYSNSLSHSHTQYVLLLYMYLCSLITSRTLCSCKYYQACTLLLY
jgi:hypothetical protein